MNTAAVKPSPVVRYDIVCDDPRSTARSSSTTTSLPRTPSGSRTWRRVASRVNPGARRRSWVRADGTRKSVRS